MLLLPSVGRTKVITNLGAVGSTTFGTSVPSHATVANSYGTVTELISAANNTQNSWGISIGVTGTGASSTEAQASLDILIGGATDDILIKALLCGTARNDNGLGWNWFFPISIPSGVRIAAQLASVRTGISAGVSIALFSGGDPPCKIGRKVTTYGTQVDNSRGQAVTLTASGGAATATQITDSTTEDHFAFYPGFQPETDSGLSGDGHVNVGIGVGASTEDRIGTWWISKTSSEHCSGPFPAYPAFANVPSGSRLTILGSNHGNNDAAYGGLIYAIS